jgi:hypothetical protein
MIVQTTKDLGVDLSADMVLFEIASLNMQEHARRLVALGKVLE